MTTLTEVEGKVLAIQAEHRDARDGIWVLFDEDGDATNRWYLDFLDEHALAVSSQLQLLRDALQNGNQTHLWYEDDPAYSHRVLHQVRIYA